MEKPMLKSRIALAILILTGGSLAIANEPIVQPEQRVVLLGDSITYAGGYIEMLDAYLATKFPGKRFELINVGLSSETACGLSEPYHPFPRPNVHERLGRLLTKMKPDVVIACYGMNDGIYHPFDEKRFEAYKAGINQLVVDCEKAGAKVILVTPPPFDPLANPKKVVKRDAKAFGYRDIYKHYDAEVMAVYAKWITEQAGRKDVAAVVDIHTPINAYMEAQRKKNPAFKMSGDGVHVNSTGHRAIASALASGLGFEDFDSTKIDPKLSGLVRTRQQLLRDAWLSEVEHKRPGVKKGKPIDAAQREATELTKKITEAK
jgi:lysophospholipase L1-like esterase